MTAKKLQSLAREHGTPLVAIDHDILRENYASFKRHLPKVQAYFAVKANAEPAIVRTLYGAGASFDVASLPEFMLVYENIKHLPPKEQQDFIWDKIIYANPTKPKETLQALDRYKPLVTYDNLGELKKISQYAPHAGVVLRLRVPNTGSMVELSSKFGCDPGEAVDLILAAFDLGLVAEGISFHVGSQCTNFQNFVQALEISAAIMREAKSRGREIKILDMGEVSLLRTIAMSNPSARSQRRSTPRSIGFSPKTSRSWLSLAGFSWRPQRPPSLASLAKPCGTAKPATTLMTVSTTPSAASFSIIANTTSTPSKRAKPRFAQYSARPAMRWTRSLYRKNCPAWKPKI